MSEPLSVTRKELFDFVIKESKENKRVFWGEYHGNGAIPALLEGVGDRLRPEADVTTAYIELDPFSTAATEGGPVRRKI